MNVANIALFLFLAAMGLALVPVASTAALGGDVNENRGGYHDSDSEPRGESHTQFSRGSGADGVGVAAVYVFLGGVNSGRGWGFRRDRRVCRRGEPEAEAGIGEGKEMGGWFSRKRSRSMRETIEVRV